MTRPNDTPHIAVIGSGPTGAIAADRLVNAGLRVTMLESGSRRPRGVIVRAKGNTLFRHMPETEFVEGDHAAVSDPEAFWFHSLSHGGLSNYWTGAVPRFHPRDFSDGAELGDEMRWPVAYDDLVEHYERAERVIGISGTAAAFDTLPANVIRHCIDLRGRWRDMARSSTPAGFPLLPIPMAKGEPWMAALRSTEFNSFTSLIEPHLDGGSMTLLSGAHVTQLLWSPERSGVIGLRYIAKDESTEKSLACDAVMVAAGAVNSTALLLRSKSTDFPDGLGNGNGVLGRYLHDHPLTRFEITLRDAVRLPHHPVYLPRASFDSSEPLLAASCTIGLASSRDRLRTYVNGTGRRLGAQIFGTMRPTIENFIGLSASRVDEFGQPAIEIGIRYADHDIANMRVARERVHDAFEHAGNPIVTAEDAEVFHPGSSVHYGGSVRMHDDPRFGVLDGRNRVHDVPNVVVCDASAFTTGPEKNPTLTAMALADRAAQLLARDLD